MPYAPTYKPGQVDNVRVSGERLRPVDNGGGWLGGVAAGLSTLGKGVASYADAEDKINELADDTNARAKALAYQQGASQLLSTFGQLKGQNAVDAKADFEADLAKLRDETLGSAANQRESRFLNERVMTVASAAATKLTDHSLTQLTEFRDTTMKDGIRQSGENAAISYNNIEAREGFMAEAKAQSEEYAKFLGVPASTVWRDTASGIHTNTVAAMVTAEDFVVAKAYLDAHGDEMTAKDRLSAMNAVKGPLDDMDAEAGFMEITSGIGPAAAGAGAATDAASNAVGVSRRRPVGGTVTNTFGQHIARKSAGLDIGGNAGSAIYSAADGVVIESRRGESGGNYVRVRHASGEVTSYMHMAYPSKLKVGDAVNGSTVLGTVGQTGNADGPHLHFQVQEKLGGKQIDPEKWLQGTSLVGSSSAARDWDEGAINAGIDKKVASGEWSLAKADRVRARAQKRFSIDNASIADTREAAAESVTNWIIANPDYTDASKAPGYNNLSPSMRLSVDDKGRATANGGGPESIKEGGDAAVSMTLEATQEPRVFAMRSPMQWLHLVSPGERKTLLKLHETTKQDINKWSPTTNLKAALTRNLDNYRGGEKIEDRERLRIGLLMRDRLGAMFRDGTKLPSEPDEDAAFRWATQQVKAFGEESGDDKGTMRRYEVDNTVRGAATRVDARTRFKEQVGRFPKNGESLDGLEAILRKKFKERYGKAPNAVELAERVRMYGEVNP